MFDGIPILFSDFFIDYDGYFCYNIFIKFLVWFQTEHSIAEVTQCHLPSGKWHFFCFWPHLGTSRHFFGNAGFCYISMAEQPSKIRKEHTLCKTVRTISTQPLDPSSRSRTTTGNRQKPASGANARSMTCVLSRCQRLRLLWVI